MSNTIIGGADFGDSSEESKRLEARYRRLGTRTPVCAWPDSLRLHGLWAGCGRNPKKSWQHQS